MTRQDQLVQDKLVQEYDIRPGKYMRFSVQIQPMGKPRMTQKDQHKPAHKRYWAYKDEVRRQVNVPLWRLPEPVTFNWVAWFQIPASLSKKEREARAGRIHRVKPDRDNIDKALMDILFKLDQRISDTDYLCKRWARGGGPGLLLEVVW